MLNFLVNANREMGLYEEGLQQAEEASEIFKQLGDSAGQAKCLVDLAGLLNDDGQLGAAEEAVSCAIDLFPEGGGGSVVSGFSGSPCSWRDLSLQEKNREGRSPSRGSPWNRILSQHGL